MFYLVQQSGSVVPKCFPWLNLLETHIRLMLPADCLWGTETVIISLSTNKKKTWCRLQLTFTNIYFHLFLSLMWKQLNLSCEVWLRCSNRNLHFLISCHVFNPFIQSEDEQMLYNWDYRPVIQYSTSFSWISYFNSFISVILPINVTFFVKNFKFI